MFSNGKGLPIIKENLTDEGLSVISYGQIHAKFNTGVDVSSDLIRFVSYNYERLFHNVKFFNMILYLLTRQRIMTVAETTVFINLMIVCYMQVTTQ